MYQVDTNVTFYSDLYNGSVIYGIPGGSVNTTITNLNGSIIAFGPMVLQNVSGFPKWAINTSFNATGDYYRRTDYYSAGALIAQSSETFRVVTNINSIAQDVSNTMTIPLLIGLSIIALIVFFSYVGYRVQNVQSVKADDLWKEPRFYLGFQFYLFAILFIIILFFFLMQLAVGQTYYDMIKLLFIVIATTFGSVMLVCAFMTVPLLVSSVYKILSGKAQ